MEEGRTSDRGDADARPEEVSDVELHVAMHHLFQEMPVAISPGIPTPQNLSRTSPHLPLVLYKPPSDIFVKLCELSRFQSSQLSTVTYASSSISSSTISQLGTNGFILIQPM